MLWLHRWPHPAPKNKSIIWLRRTVNHSAQFSSNYIVPVHNSSHCTVSLHRILYCIQAKLQPCNSFVVFDMLELFCAEIWWRWRAWRKQAFTAVIIKLCSETQRQNTHVQPAHVHKSFSQLGETTGRFQSCMQHRSETCAWLNSFLTDLTFH